MQALFFLFFGHCIGLLTLVIRGTWVEVMILLNIGLATGCSLKRLQGLMFARIALSSISSLPVPEGIEIRQGCRFISSLVMALGKLPSGLGRFLRCSVGSIMSRRGHLGWEQCSHCLASRPLQKLSSPVPQGAPLLHHSLLQTFSSLVNVRRLLLIYPGESGYSAKRGPANQ